MPPPFLPPSALNPWLIDVFRQLIIERTGLDIKTQNQAALCKTIMARTRATHQLIPENYYQLLMEPTPKGDREWQQLMVLLTNPESFFFRDKGQLGVLQQQILPELLQRHHLDKKLRICSAGCSTGEEPYSIAILLKELIPDLPEWDLIVFGVDINPVSIQKAQAGVYDPWSFRGVDESLWQTYFRRVNKQFHIDPQLKKLVKFKRLNLVSDPLMLQAGEQANATLDLIICRNVFIYFDAAAISKVIDKFYQALQPLGYFIAGHTELYGQNLNRFHVKNLTDSLVFQRPPQPLLASRQESPARN